MEDSCPATPLILTGRDSKSPLQVALSSPESDGMKSPSRDSPDSRCVICLGRLQNKSFTDSCLHQFCFQCLLQWSKIKAECPLCKQPFKSIIHNVRSNLDYDQYHVEHGEPRYVLSDTMHSYNFDLLPVDRRFRYRSTMTRDYFRELAASFLAHTRRLPEDSYQINPLVPVDPAPPANLRRSNRLHVSSSTQHRTRQRGTSDFRRNVYAQDLWVQDLVDISGRYRECTPQFYRENPAQIHRIIPWLNREVNVLLSDCRCQGAYVLSRIVSLLTQHPIRSKEFREQIHSYFGDRTDHFIHELYIFARSVYDIAGFDQNAVYGTNRNYAMVVQEISSSSSDNDSDIEVLETVKTEERSLGKSSRQGPRKVLLKRAAEPRSDEPVAGPSGVSSARTSEPIDICESDPEEVKVLDYVKPEPEVVTLSSGEDMAVYSDLDTSNGEYAEVVVRSETNKERRSSSRESDKNKSSTYRTGKGKCRSNGFGLKGRQKRKYIKSTKYRSSSSNGCSSGISSSSSWYSRNSNGIKSSSSGSKSRSRSNSRDSVSSSSSSDSVSSSSSSDSTISSSTSSSNNTSNSGFSSTSSKSTHKSSSKSKRKKSKTYRKKLKRKGKRKLSGKHKNYIEKETRKRKKVKSCVIVPNWPCDSPPRSHGRLSTDMQDEPKNLKSYWSMPLDNRSDEWVEWWLNCWSKIWNYGENECLLCHHMEMISGEKFGKKQMQKIEPDGILTFKRNIATNEPAAATTGEKFIEGWNKGKRRKSDQGGRN